MAIDRLNRSGRFTDRFIYEVPQELVDSVGQVLYGPQAGQGSWLPVVELWTHIEDTYGVEQKQSSKETNEEWAVLQVRYASSLRELLLPSMRARHKVYDTIYDIRSVLPRADGERKIIEMTCLLVR